MIAALRIARGIALASPTRLEVAVTAVVVLVAATLWAWPGPATFDLLDRVEIHRRTFAAPTAADLLAAMELSVAEDTSAMQDLIDRGALWVQEAGARGEVIEARPDHLYRVRLDDGLAVWVYGAAMGPAPDR